MTTLLSISAALALAACGAEPDQWRSLFDGKSLDGWSEIQFGGEGDVKVKDGALVLEMGDSLTGVVLKADDLPKTNYEIQCEAMRVDGIDFFCGLTFPVGESHCSFIVGGWAGAVVGLSSIDGMDASENNTTTYRKFEKGKWYKIRVRVTPKFISCWIDDERVVHQEIEGRKVTTRNEVNPSKPLGFCSWQTKAALRNIRVRKITP